MPIVVTRGSSYEVTWIRCARCDRERKTTMQHHRHTATRFAMTALVTTLPFGCMATETPEDGAGGTAGTGVAGSGAGASAGQGGSAAGAGGGTSGSGGTLGKGGAGGASGSAGAG